MACGGRMMWFDKKNPNALFIDNREFEDSLCDGRVFKVKPDIVMDFRDLKFPDESFSLVVFDPPHLIPAGENGWQCKKYGSLSRKTWKDDITKGFSECFRVLKCGGVLVFKWNEHHVGVQDVIALTPVQPLFGHTTGRSGKTKWICFMKV